MSDQRYISGVTPHSGGGVPQTDWSPYRLDEIWDMVRDEDRWVNWTQHDAWRRMAALCTDQADQLERALNQLLERWPPRPGSAAEAFKNQVSHLVSSMRQNAQAALDNQDPLRKISYAISLAQAEIAALLEQRRTYALAEQQLIPQPTPAPGQIPIPAAPPDLQRPPDNWRATLDLQARTVMATTDAAVGAEAARINVPARYTFGVPIQIKTNGIGGTVPTGSFRGPTIPAMRFDPPPPHGGPLSTMPASFDADPVLAGTTVPSPPLSNAPNIIGSIPYSAGAGSFAATPYPTVLAPGGIIGARAPAGQKTSGESGRAPGGGAAGRAGTQGAMPMAPMVPPPAGFRPLVASGGGVAASGRAGVGAAHWRRSTADPDDPWAVREGGPAVLEPGREPTDHDPGPGVIGLSR